MNKIGILNYGTGNLLSVVKSFTQIGESPSIIHSRAELAKVSALVLPGVGHFGSVMRFLRARKFIDDLRAAFRDGLPTLGICLGFQLLCETSEEDLSTSGLGFLPLSVVRLNAHCGTYVKIPQIGWNTVVNVRGRPKLLDRPNTEQVSFYFANSFGVRDASKNKVNASASYFHGENYLALAESDFIFGVQFHPEKSGEQGRQVFRNFARIAKTC